MKRFYSVCVPLQVSFNSIIQTIPIRGPILFNDYNVSEYCSPFARISFEYPLKGKQYSIILDLLSIIRRHHAYDSLNIFFVHYIQLLPVIITSIMINLIIFF